MDVLAILRADCVDDGQANHAVIRHIAGRTGLSYYTLRKLVKGYSRNPSYRTAETLRRYYDRMRQRRRS
ncbi:MAG TPA: hypothetical protein VMS04_11035 [Vicinamibacterales bacterium]|jgi:hypothetical protein|nr:hypothetical protein [Vicinamibacterales bacterium]